MPKRQTTTTDDDSGLDSLLDTMTNVVGILVLVLIVAQLGVADVVDRVISKTKVNPEMIEQSQAMLTEKEAEAAELKQLLYEPLQIDVEKQREQLQRKRELLDRRKQLLAEKQQQKNEFALKIEADKQKAEQLQQEMQQINQRRNELEQLVSQSLDEKAELAALLDETPVTDEKPGEIAVTVPNPRPAPKDAKPLTLICTANQLYPVNLEVFRQRAATKAKQLIARHQLLRDPESGIDPEEFIRRYELLRDQDDYFDVEYFVQNNRYPRLRFVPRENRGISIRELTARRQQRRLRWLGQIDPAKYYARFHVLPDSFEVYTAARRAFDAREIPAGWNPQSKGWQLTTTVPGIRLGPPPKPKPPPPPPPPGSEPKKPAPPPNVID